MSRIRLESCTIEIDGRSMLAKKPKPKIHVETARLVVPLGFVATVVQSHLPHYSFGLPDGATTPQVAFSGDFEVEDILPAWSRKLVPEGWKGAMSVEGLLELRTSPSGRLQVIVLEATVAGLTLPKALNIQRRVLDHVRGKLVDSPYLRKGVADALLEIDPKALAARAGIDLDLPAASNVSMEGESIVISYGVSKTDLKRASSARVHLSAVAKASKASRPSPKRAASAAGARGKAPAPASRSKRK